MKNSKVLSESCWCINGHIARSSVGAGFIIELCTPMDEFKISIKDGRPNSVNFSDAFMEAPNCADSECADCRNSILRLFAICSFLSTKLLDTSQSQACVKEDDDGSFRLHLMMPRFWLRLCQLF